MHDQSILHVRDHSKAVGPSHHLLEFIATHVNEYTGEAFELTVDRVAARLGITPQWVRELRVRLVASGELICRQSPGPSAQRLHHPLRPLPSLSAGQPETAVAG